ncbi:MAG: DMT family transporter [Candidatus Diapherotrites archaeon]|nr:DMT family transporter [Candidatus Diapherotrites archaeon]
MSDFFLDNYQKGLAFVFLTALVSGFSIYFNSLAVKGLNPFVFTTTKNIIVAFLLLGLLFLAKEFNSLKKLPAKQWAKLAAIGIIGGSIPFWLYFYAIKIGSEIYSTPYGVVAGFFHKATLFAFVTILAVVFLREKISKGFLAGGLLLLAGNFLLAQNLLGVGFPELLLFTAIILWAIENVLSKWALRELSGNQVAFGRMFFGSIVLAGLLFATGQGNQFLAFDGPTLFWGLATAVPLFFYVFFLYNGLKHVEASKAAAILLLGQPVTLAFSFLFNGAMPKTIELVSAGLIIAGVILAIGYSKSISTRQNPFTFPRETQ